MKLVWLGPPTHVNNHCHATLAVPRPGYTCMYKINDTMQGVRFNEEACLLAGDPLLKDQGKTCTNDIMKMPHMYIAKKEFELYWNHTSIEDTLKVFWFNGPHFRGSYVCLQLIPITTS